MPTNIDSFFLLIVEITIKGQVNPNTGMVMNLTDLKDCIKSSIMDVLDHRNLVCYRVGHCMVVYW